MASNYPLLERSFLSSPVVNKDSYPYFVNPVSDGVPVMEPALLEEVIAGILETADLDCDVVLAPEAMGISLAACVTLMSGIPYSVIRKRPYGLPGEITLNQRTGYSRSPMYVNCITPGTRAAIVDDVVSTGGTVRAIVGALRGAGVTVTEVVTVFCKGGNVSRLEEELGVPIRFLLAVSLEGGRLAIL